MYAGVAPAVSGHLNRSKLAVDPDKQRLVLTFMITSRLQYYDSEGTLLRSVAGPHEVIPRYTYDGQFRLDPERGRWAYRDVAATNEYVVALFSGSSSGGGREIQVFTWDGALVGTWGVDEELGWIAVAPDGKTIYGVRWEPNPAILEYEPLPLPTGRRSEERLPAGQHER